MNVDVPTWALWAGGAVVGNGSILWVLLRSGVTRTWLEPTVVSTLTDNTKAGEAVTAIAVKAIAAHDIAAAARHQEQTRAEIETQVQRVDGQIRQLVESAVTAANDKLAQQIADLGTRIDRREEEKARHVAQRDEAIVAKLERLSTDVAQLRAIQRQQIDTPRELAGRGMPAADARRHDSGRLPPPEPPPRRPTPAFGVERIDTDE